MGTRASILDPARLQLVAEMNLLGTLFVQRRRPDHEATAFREDHHGKLGRWDRTVR
jgi:hypothetical protein